jgi:hypothetical protein
MLSQASQVKQVGRNEWGTSLRGNSKTSASIIEDAEDSSIRYELSSEFIGNDGDHQEDTGAEDDWD